MESVFILLQSEFHAIQRNAPEDKSRAREVETTIMPIIFLERDRVLKKFLI
jgi:hypothetical protein